MHSESANLFFLFTFFLLFGCAVNQYGACYGACYPSSMCRRAVASSSHLQLIHSSISVSLLITSCSESTHLSKKAVSTPHLSSLLPNFSLPLSPFYSLVRPP